jgi:hypothetical protein
MPCLADDPSEFLFIYPIAHRVRIDTIRTPNRLDITGYITSQDFSERLKISSHITAKNAGIPKSKYTPNLATLSFSPSDCSCQPQ